MHKSLMRHRVSLCRTEYRRILILAMADPRHTADESDYIHYQLDRANLLPDAALPEDVVRVGSKVSYCCDGARVRTVTIAYPDDADTEAAAVSVLSSVGVSLIGLQPGQSVRRMDWNRQDFCQYEVLSVTPPSNKT